MISGEDYLISRFVLRSCMALDREDFDAWLSCFSDDGRYVVMPRENRLLGHSIALISCDSKKIIEDRISVLRHASKYNPHFDRHIVGSSYVKDVSGGVATAETNFMIVQTSLEGVSKLFCTGCYEDRIAVHTADFKLLARVVLLDTFAVPNLIATPL